MSIIEWDENGYPTEESLERLEEALKIGKSADEWKRAVNVFYEAVKENVYSDYCGPERVEVRGETKDVWGYHTGGWSGNEDIINVLKRSCLWGSLIERYDSGGHYYFKPKEEFFKE